MLVPELTRQYDEAFKSFDVLVMPTMPFVATPLTAPDAPVEEYVHSALNMLANTAPFDLTGHPATSIPAGLTNRSGGSFPSRRVLERMLETATRQPNARIRPGVSYQGPQADR